MIHMEIRLLPRATAWRGRGRPPTQVDPRILSLLDATHNTGQIGSISPAGRTDADTTEVLAQLRAGAKQRGCLLRIQEDEDGTLRFEMRDRPAARGGPALGIA